MLEKKIADATKGVVKIFNGGIFKTKHTQDFLTKVDITFKDAVTLACTKFQNYSVPVVELSVMKDLIDKAPAIVGLLWGLMLELRGKVRTREG